MLFCHTFKLNIKALFKPTQQQNLKMEYDMIMLNNQN